VLIVNLPKEAVYNLIVQSVGGFISELLDFQEIIPTRKSPICFLDVLLDQSE
jgi:hypothetical protein